MAKRPAPNTNTQIQKWDEELAAAAQVVVESEVASGGQFFSVRGGVLQFNDAPLPGNEVAVVIVDYIFENVFYEGEFNPEQPQGPTCFAFARSENDLAPHAMVVEKQHDKCSGCPRNEWGSADRGRGKACRNIRRLGLILAGDLKNGQFTQYDAEHFATAQPGYLKVPVTSVKGFASFAKQVAAVLRRPPWAIFTKVKVVSDPRTQFRVVFEPISEVPNELLSVLKKRNDEVSQLIAFPYVPMEDAADQPAPRAAQRTKSQPKKSAPPRGQRPRR